MLASPTETTRDTIANSDTELNNNNYCPITVPEYLSIRRCPRSAQENRLATPRTKQTMYECIERHMFGQLHMIQHISSHVGQEHIGWIRILSSTLVLGMCMNYRDLGSKVGQRHEQNDGR
jgi:hypothetical protein